MAYEILEHTADVGVRARGPSLEETFREATLGLLAITGTWQPDGGEEVPLELEGSDVGALLVDWLNEVLYLQDVRDDVVSEVVVERASATRVAGTLRLKPRGGLDPEGTAVKAITYHQLAAEQTSEGWTLTVFVDV